MQVLLLGADGFIGRHIAFYLRASGVQVVCVARNTVALDRMGFEVLQADLTNTEIDWAQALQGCDAIINAAGMLNGTAKQMQAVHVESPANIYHAAQAAGVAKIVLISAVGVEADTPFGRTKMDGEQAVQQANIPYVILRPSMVLAETSYGGSSLMRALAALPFMTPTIGDGGQKFDPIHADDLANVVFQCLESNQLDGKTIEPCGPEQISQLEMIRATRAWLGRSTTKHVALPMSLAHAVGWLGDRLKLGPISTTAVAQLEQGVSTDYAQFHGQTGQTPRGFSEIIGRPAGTQDLWHARLYLLRPLVRFGLMFMWLISGLVGLFLPTAQFANGLAPLGLSDANLTILARTAGVMDLGFALGLLLAWKLCKLAMLQLLAVGGYTIAFGLLVPDLWLEPYGGLLKNIPVLVLILIHRVLEEER